MHPGPTYAPRCTWSEPTDPHSRTDAAEPTTASLHYCAFSLPRARLRLFYFPGPPRTAQSLLFPGDLALVVVVVRSLPFPSLSILHAPARSRSGPLHTSPRTDPPLPSESFARRRRRPRRSSLRARPPCKRIRSLSRFSVPIFWICFVIFGNRLVNPIFPQVLQLVLFVDWNY